MSSAPDNVTSVSPISSVSPVPEIAALFKTETKYPKLFLVMWMPDGTPDTLKCRVSRDVQSAHAFTQTLLHVGAKHLYTQLEVKGVTQLPFPNTVHLLTALRSPTDEMREMAIGLYKTEQARQEGARELRDRKIGYRVYMVHKCPVNFGLSTEEYEYLQNVFSDFTKRSKSDGGGGGGGGGVPDKSGSSDCVSE